jgi:hypothetical protein
MAKKLDLLNRLSASKDAQARAGSGDGMLADLMANPDYLRHSSSVVRRVFDIFSLITP